MVGTIVGVAVYLGLLLALRVPELDPSSAARLPGPLRLV